mmetsp:Transcript_34414/g.135357  ORF Transcript_34414/g.135357 Transcript_34414/m.135357 type:complete len:487 (-) Transcript_34414:2693-4153(-)
MFQGYHLRNSTFRNTRPGQELTGWLFQVKSSGVIRSRRKKRLVKLQGHRLTVLDAQTGDVKQDLYLSAGSVDGVPEDKVLTISIKTKKLVLVAETEKEYTQWLSSFTYAFRRLEQYYELGKEIGRGAFSIVRQGRMRENSKPVAVKVIQNIGEARFLHRNEIEILARVEHENIVQTHDVFERKTETYIVMEYMRGGELYDVIAEADSFSEKISREVLRDILKGIQYLHSNGIVHRDLKPENLLCNSKIFPPLVKIADFGLSAYLGSDRGEMLNTLVGSPGYVAPEILLKIPYSKPVDMWAVRAHIHSVGFYRFWKCGLLLTCTFRDDVGGSYFSSDAYFAASVLGEQRERIRRHGSYRSQVRRFRMGWYFSRRSKLDYQLAVFRSRGSTFRGDGVETSVLQKRPAELADNRSSEEKPAAFVSAIECLRAKGSDSEAAHGQQPDLEQYVVVTNTTCGNMAKVEESRGNRGYVACRNLMCTFVFAGHW